MTRLTLFACFLFLTTGCGLVQHIDYPEAMTADEAKQIIAEYTAKNSKLTREQAAARTTDSEFPSLRIEGQSVGSFQVGRVRYETRWRVEQCDYSQVRDHALYHTGHNWLSPVTAFIAGPTSLCAAEVGIPTNEVYSKFIMSGGPTSYVCWRVRPKTSALSLIPLWLVGLPFWWTTDEEEYLQALLFMRDHAAQS